MYQKLMRLCRMLAQPFVVQLMRCAWRALRDHVFNDPTTNQQRKP